MVQIKFKAFGSNSAFGGFAPGDTLRTNEAMAKHLVELGLAVYAKAEPAPQAEPDAEPKPTQRKKRGEK